MTVFELKDRGIPNDNTFLTRPTTKRTTYARVFYMHYKRQTNVFATSIKPHDFNPLETEIGYMEPEDIRSCTISKSLGSPSGSFSIDLYPTYNWKATVSPGDWVIIYFYQAIGSKSQDVKKKNSDDEVVNPPNDLVNGILIGNIDRIARIVEKDKENDKTILKYMVSGRNFGKVYEDTEIWFDPYVTNANLVDTSLRAAGLTITGSPDEQVKKIADIFLGRGSVPEGKGGPLGTTDKLVQWQIPPILADVTSTPGELASDMIGQDITSNLPGHKTRTMLTVGDSGPLWDFMKQNANMAVNELFCEEVRGADGSFTPTLIMRPRPVQSPFFQAQFTGSINEGLVGPSISDQSLSKLNGAYKSIQDHAKTNRIDISPSEIIYENLGRDGHSRFNLMSMNTRTDLDYFHSRHANVSPSEKIANPLLQRDSINRWGARIHEYSNEYVDPAEKGTKADPDLWRGFFMQVYDQNFANHMYEAGTIETTGVLEAELGSILRILPQGDINDIDGPQAKLYYIEGYEHRLAFPNTWTTVWTVSHGQFEIAGTAALTGKQKFFIDSSEDDFGQEDFDLNSVFIAKTVTRNKD